jgi:L-iditol 2-dehydrogenase
MKALVLRQNGELVVEERDRPMPSRSLPVVIKVASVGVCGSDIPRAFDGGAYHYPLVLGHEFSGIVDAVSDEAAAPPLNVGQRVAVFPLIPDRAETINEIGEYAVASQYDYFGSRRDGAMQEYLAVPSFNCIPIPDHVSLDEAAMVEPCAVAYHAVARPDITPGMSGLVIGGGPIGNMVSQWLRVRGCDPVMVSEPDERKRAICSDMGFSVINPRSQGVRETVAARTGGGADIVVEACGAPATYVQAVEAAGLFGQVVFLGNISGDLEVPKNEVSRILRRELTIYGVWNSKVVPRGNDEWTRVLKSIGRTIHVEPLISHRVSLEEAAGTLSAMHQRARWFNKVILQCGEPAK